MARKKDQQQRRTELRHAAAKAIAARGTTGVTLRDIAQEAKLSPSSILYYYRDLEQLIVEAMQHGMERFHDRRLEAAERYADPREKLVATIVRGFPTDGDDLDVLLLYLGVPVIRRNPAVVGLARSLTGSQVSLYHSILEVGSARGVFELNDDTYTIGRNLVALEDAYGLYVISGNADRLGSYVALTVAYASTSTGCDLRPLADSMSPETLDLQQVR